MREEWKDIAGYEGLYQVSNLGRVKSLDRVVDARHHVKEKELKVAIIQGYCIIRLCKNSKIKNCRLHRLVAEAFIPNPDNLPEVNHKDENKENNSVENLEWCTPKYNSNYGKRVEKIISKMNKAVLQYSTDGTFIKEYQSITEAEIAIKGRRTGAIKFCLSGKTKATYGYIWRYKEAE